MVTKWHWTNAEVLSKPFGDQVLDSGHSFNQRLSQHSLFLILREGSAKCTSELWSVGMVKNGNLKIKWESLFSYSGFLSLSLSLICFFSGSIFCVSSKNISVMDGSPCAEAHCQTRAICHQRWHSSLPSCWVWVMSFLLTKCQYDLSPSNIYATSDCHLLAMGQNHRLGSIRPWFFQIPHPRGTLDAWLPRQVQVGSLWFGKA